MKNELIIYNNYSVLKEECKSCGKNNHSILKCPLINLFINKERVILKYKNSNFQKRELFRYSRKIRFCALGIKKKINFIQYSRNFLLFIY